MQKIVIASAVLGLVGCTPGLALGALQLGGGGWGDNSFRGNDPERMCAGATPGRARHACLAAHGDDTDQSSEDDRRHARENAAVRATGERLERGRAETRTRLATRTDMKDRRMAPHLDRGLVSNGIATVSTQFRGCRDSSAATGQVAAEVTVDARGCVVAVAIESAPDRQLGACVAATLEHATFAPTETGGAFRYRYTF